MEEMGDKLLEFAVVCGTLRLSAYVQKVLKFLSWPFVVEDHSLRMYWTRQLCFRAGTAIFP